MPQPPSWLDKVNFVIDYFANPCDAPLIVYAETIGPALGEAVLALLDFGLDDIVRGALRPRNLRETSHMKRGFKNGRRGVEIPEIGDMIGKNVPGAEIAKGREIVDGAKKLWILDGLAQRAAYNLMLIGITTDFFYNWHSAIIRESCGDREGFGSAYNKAGPNYGFFFLADYQPIATPNQVYQRGTAACSFTGGCSNSGRPFRSTCALSVRTLDGSPFSLSMICKVGNFVIGLAQGGKYKPGEAVELILSKESSTGAGHQYFAFSDKLVYGSCDLSIVGY